MPHLRFLAVAAALAMASAACGATDTSPERPRATPEPPATARPEPAGTITVYARDRQIAEPLFEQFEEKTGIAVQARWGNPIDLAQQIIDDGAASPADVYYGPFSDALGALSAAGRLAPLSAAELDRVPTEYRSPDGTWVGTSGRAHVVFYNTDKLRPDDLPDSILGFADPAWRGRIGWDPTSRSLQDVVAELEQLEGADAARNWLEGVVANAPASIQGAPAVVKAVAAGELVEVGFGSHSYLNLVQADGEAPNVAARFYLGSEPGGILNVAGVGIVDTTDKPAEAKALVDFMLSNQAQLLLAESAYEIPVIPGVQPPPGMPTAEQLEVRGLDIRKFEQLTDARRLLIETGVIGLPESSLRSYGDSVPEEHGNPDTEVRRLMDDEFDWERRDHLVARLDR
ncbi:MAG TPA: extracellular solute-binding protein, partial [Candidatus Limnocylindrales bacterium]|nr:extracellular solute-binding protein [Candidatus Limnocylindrales bacterium]